MSSSASRSGSSAPSASTCSRPSAAARCMSRQAGEDVRLGDAASCLWVEQRREHASAPSRERPSPCPAGRGCVHPSVGERIERFLELPAVLGQLVHSRRRGRGSFRFWTTPPASSSRSARGECSCRFPACPRAGRCSASALEQLTDHEEGPPLANEAERVTDRGSSGRRCSSRSS